MIRALLLDLDDTLMDERNSVRKAYLAFIEFHRRELDASADLLLPRWREIAIRHWLRFEHGEISFQEHRRERVREFLGRPFTDAEADAALAPYVAAYQASWRLFDEVPAFLRRTSAIPKIIITNGERNQQRQKVEHTGLSPFMRATLTPMDCDAWKPDPRIFLAATELLNVAPSDCAMLGDDEFRDIEPARQLGMKAFRVDAKDPERTLTRALDALSVGS
jgi:putative hydrolase of the HAD superfamily